MNLKHFEKRERNGSASIQVSHSHRKWKTGIVLLLTVGLVACSGEFRPDICTVTNLNKVRCVPTDPSKDKYDIEISSGNLIGYACFSEEHFSEGKKRARKALENLNFSDAASRLK
jgi:hypothetical protein